MKCFRVKCDQDGWNVQEDLRKESTTTFHKVFAMLLIKLALKIDKFALNIDKLAPITLH